MTKEQAINLAKKYAEKNGGDFYVLNAPIESDTPDEPYEVCCIESKQLIFPRAVAEVMVYPNGRVINLR
jgi:hypothetical protein